MSNLTDKFRPPATRICTGCKKEKPLKEFYLNAESRDGRHSKCRGCLRAIEEQKKIQQIEKAKTFFDAKFFTLALLLATSAAFSQVVPGELPRGEYTLEVKPTAGEAIPPITTPDTNRAIILVTLSPNGIAHARMGYVVIEQGKRPVYLDCHKRALKWPQVGWDWREVDVNYKQK